MKNLLKYLAFAGLVAVAVSGCGDDPVQPPSGNGGGQFTFKQNDKYTYNYYTHDEANQRDNSSKQVKVWTVLNVNQSIGGQSGVSVIDEQTFESNGTTPIGARDTFYIRTTSDGKVYQYNLLRSVVKRIPGASVFIDSVPPAWIQISNTSATSATTWSATGGAPVSGTVTIGGFPTTINLTMPATHKGTQSVTVPKGTIANSVHTDHQVVIAATNQFLSTSDSVMVSTMSPPPRGSCARRLPARPRSSGTEPADSRASIWSWKLCPRPVGCINQQNIKGLPPAWGWPPLLQTDMARR